MAIGVDVEDFVVIMGTAVSTSVDAVWAVLGATIVDLGAVPGVGMTAVIGGVDVVVVGMEIGESKNPFLLLVLLPACSVC